MRLPRKEKKRAKKIVAKKSALKAVMASVVTAQALAQVAVIRSMPYGSPDRMIDRPLQIVNVSINTAQAISKIMSEPPNSWKDFCKIAV